MREYLFLFSYLQPPPSHYLEIRSLRVASMGSSSLGWVLSVCKSSLAHSVYHYMVFKRGLYPFGAFGRRWGYIPSITNVSLFLRTTNIPLSLFFFSCHLFVPWQNLSIMMKKGVTAAYLQRCPRACLAPEITFDLSSLIHFKTYFGLAVMYFLNMDCLFFLSYSIQ